MLGTQPPWQTTIEAYAFHSAAVDSVFAAAAQYVPNSYTIPTRYVGMDTLDLDPDKLMITAGILISLIAVLEFYPAWKRARRQ